MEEQGNSNQFRFLLAAVLSMVVLFGWTYFYAPTKPAGDANTAANTAANSNTTVTQTAAGIPVPSPTIEVVCEEGVARDANGLCQNATIIPENAQARTITIGSSLYEVKLDSRGGGLATSWIVKRNESSKTNYPVFADGSNGENKKPLQLISQRALEQSPREIPFRLMTGDNALDLMINEGVYEVAGAETDTIVLNDGDARTVEFVLRSSIMLAGNTQPLEVRKKYTFTGNSYISDLAVSVLLNGQPIPNVKLAIGASIGDHAINYHNLYQTESEAVAAVNGDIRRHQGGYSFTYDANGRSTLVDTGTIDWVAMGDTYFAMAAIPASPVQGAEYHAFKYDVAIEPVYNSIFSWVTRSATVTETRHLVTAYMPIVADGSTTKIYTGSKDYFLLNELSNSLKAADGRPVSLVDLINFSNYWWLRWLTKPLSIPIVYALHFFNSITHSYGLAIIIFTFLFYSLLFPLRWSQSKSFKKASGNAPKMKEIQDKIKELQKKGVPMDDPRMRDLQMQQLRMTKDALPIGGCLPMLLQFPLLLAFYTAITISLDARQASFMWLPDLSAADPWHILEFAFAGSMVLAMKFTPTAATVTPEQQMQQKMMTYLMPVMMLWVMWTAPAGLLLYWLFGNVVSFAQQMLINRMNKTNEPPTAEIVKDVPRGAKNVKAKLSTS